MFEKQKKAFAEGLQREVKKAKLKEDKKLVGPVGGRSHSELSARLADSPAYRRNERSSNYAGNAKLASKWYDVHNSKVAKLKRHYTAARHGYGAN